MSTREASRERRKEDRTYLLRCYYQLTKVSKKSVADDKASGTSGETMCTLLPIAYSDLSLDVTVKLLQQLERRGVTEGISGETKAKHLRICTIMETHNNNVYAVPKAVPVARTVRKSLLNVPESPQPLVGSAVILSLKQLKKENKSYDDESKTSNPLAIPSSLKAFLEEAFPMRALPANTAEDIVVFDDGTTGTPRGLAEGRSGVPPNTLGKGLEAAPSTADNGGVPPPPAPKMKMPPGKKMPAQPPTPTTPAASPTRGNEGKDSDSPHSAIDEAARRPTVPPLAPVPENNNDTTARSTSPLGQKLSSPKSPSSSGLPSASQQQGVDFVATIHLKANAANQRILGDYLNLVEKLENDVRNKGGNGVAISIVSDVYGSTGPSSNYVQKQQSPNSVTSPKGKRIGFAVDCVYFRGDAALDIIRDAIAKMRVAVSSTRQQYVELKEHTERTAAGRGAFEEDTQNSSALRVFESILGYLGRLSPHAAMLAVPNPASSSSAVHPSHSGDAADDLFSFSGEDPVPALNLPSSTATKISMALIDMGHAFIPKSKGGGFDGGGQHSKSVNTLFNSATDKDTAAIEQYAERLRREQQGVKDLTGVNYALREANLNKLAQSVELMLKENAEIEREVAEAEEALAQLEAEAAAVAEESYSAKTAAADIERLRTLKQWFEETLRERARANTELQQRVLLGDDYSPLKNGQGEEGNASGAYHDVEGGTDELIARYF